MPFVIFAVGEYLSHENLAGVEVNRRDDPQLVASDIKDIHIVHTVEEVPHLREIRQVRFFHDTIPLVQRRDAVRMPFHGFCNAAVCDDAHVPDGLVLQSG